MSKFTKAGTRALQQLAEEVEKERREKGRTPFDEVPESESGDHSSTREDYEGTEDSLGELDDPTRAGAVGNLGRIARPGL